MANETKRGECQVCERMMAEKGGLLSHHGYKRPGWGWLVGGCPGSLRAPFPATDALEDTLRMVEDAIADQVRLAEAEAVTLRVEVGRARYVGRRRVRTTVKVDSVDEWLALVDHPEVTGMQKHQFRSQTHYADTIERQRNRHRRMAAQFRVDLERLRGRIAKGREARGVAS